MTELYIMQRYLRPSLLENAGLQTFDDWASNFGEVVSKAELKPAGNGYRTKKLIDRLIDADDVLFGYIQEKISELHAKKNEYEKQLLLIERKVKKIDTKPLLEPLNRWDELTMEEKNALAKVMIDRIDVTDEEGIKIHFIF